MVVLNKKYSIAVLSLLVVALAVFYGGYKAYAAEACASGDTVNEFPYRFICPHSTSNDTDAFIYSINGTPGGGDASAPQVVPAGSTIELATGVRIAGNAKHPPLSGDTNGQDTYGTSGSTRVEAYIWTTVDVRNETLASIEAINDGDAAKNFELNGNDPLGDPTVPGKGGEPCPGSEAAHPTIYAHNNSANDKSPYQGADGALDERKTSCGSEGRMGRWRIATPDAGDVTRKIRINLTSDIPSATQSICVRTNISVPRYDGQPRYPQYNSSGDMTDEGYLSRVAKKSRKICFQVVPYTLHGIVQSVTGPATGKGLQDVRASLDRGCDGTVDEEVDSASGTSTSGPKAGWAKGEYKFRITQGQRFCLSAPTQLRPAEGTNYDLIDRQYQHFGRTDSLQYINQVAAYSCPDNHSSGHSASDPNHPIVSCRYTTNTSWDIDDSGVSGGQIDHSYNFTYGPLPGNITLSKSVDVGDNTNVKPGDTLNYTITATNNFDNNMPGVSIEDFIPKNIDPNTAVIDTISINTNLCDPNRPGYSSPCDPNYGWKVGPINNLPGSICTGTSQLIPYGWVGTPTTYPGATFACGKDFFYNRDRIYLNFGRLPAYSQVTIKWHGNVKSAADVDVYPTDNQCPASGSCVDRTNGLQAVINNVRTETSGLMGYGFSTPTVTNPIPGAISLAKSVTGFTSFGGEEAYSIDKDQYNGAYFTSTVTPDPQLGPVWYQVIDQDNGAADYNGSSMNPAIASITGIDPPGTLSGSLPANNAVLKWNEQNSAAPGAQNEYSFTVDEFDGDVAVGSYATNVSKACYPKYWVVGHEVECKVSNPARVKRVRLDEPNIAVDYGAVTGGGNISIRDNGAKCDVVDGARGGLVGNAGSYGTYMLSVKNQTTYNAFTSKSGFGVSSSTPADGLSCRPDITKEARNYTNSTPLPSGCISGEPTGYTNKVVKGSGDVCINNLTVNGRWTIFVEGRVYIKGNITRRAVGALALGNSDSLGIVATDGIYISKDVSRIDALLYAGGYNEFSNNYSSGVIDTCADENNRLQARTSTPGYTAANCRERNLTVNGVMYAKTLRLNRTKVSVSDYADRINLGNINLGVNQGGQAFLMMPPAFNALVNKGNSGSVREQRPRF